MSFLRIAAGALVTFALAGAGLSAHAVVIDFDALDSSSGQTPLNFGAGTFMEDGFTFSVSVTSSDTPPRAVLFDTTCTGRACNDDFDLVPAMQGENGIAGNILIVQEQGSAIPDDAGAPGGTITLTSNSGNSAFRLTGASVIDNGTFEFFSIINSVRSPLGRASLSGESETARLIFNSGVLNPGDSIVINFLDSGGVDSLALSPVPIPAALPLFLSALAGFGLTARSRRQKKL